MELSSTQKQLINQILLRFGAVSNHDKFDTVYNIGNEYFYSEIDR